MERRDQIMDKELDDLLVRKFPLLYKDRYKSMQETCMCWGFDTGNGWFLIIYNLSQKLEKIILAMPENERDHYRASQIKSKFGSLRAYLSASTDEMQDLIDEA